MTRNWLIVILLVLVGGGAAWHFHHKNEHDQFVLETRALATAQLWLATAKFAQDSVGFNAYRDSLLVAAEISKEEMSDFLLRYESEPERYIDFTGLVGTYVDSLVKTERQKQDSLKPRDNMTAPTRDSN